MLLLMLLPARRFLPSFSVDPSLLLLLLLLLLPAPRMPGGIRGPGASISSTAVDMFTSPEAAAPAATTNATAKALSPNVGGSALGASFRSSLRGARRRGSTGPQGAAETPWSLCGSSLREARWKGPGVR